MQLIGVVRLYCGEKMKRIRQCCLLVLLGSSLLGCATTGNTIAENLISVPHGKGLVLFSTGAAKTNLSFSTCLTLVEGTSQKKYDKVIINIDYPVSSYFPNEHGHVRTLALSEGEYYLLPRSGNPDFVMTKSPVYKFRVANNRITYIGNFQLYGNLLSWSESKYRRDVDYFVQKNPAMASIPVEPQKIEIVSDVSQFKIKGIIWDVP
jgi:hypothetical protein